MNQIKLKKLKVKGFRSFLEESEILFPDNGMFCVQGKDLRSGGSNGSGKSSLFEAVYWILGLNSLPATELKNYSSPSMEGYLELESNGNKIEIFRTSTKLSLVVNGHETSGMKAEIESKITEILGDAEIFESLSYRRQSDQGLFFYSTDSDIKKFLTKCIPEIDKLEKISVDAQKTSDQLQSKIDNLLVVINGLESQEDIRSINISALEQRNIELGVAVDLERERLSSIDESVFTNHSELNRLSTLRSNFKSEEYSPSLTDEELLLLKQKSKEAEVLVNQLAELGQVDSIKKAFEGQKKSLSESIKQLADKERDLDRKKGLLQNLQVSLLKIDNDIKHLSESNCPTCLRTWEEARIKADELNVIKKNIMRDILITDSDLKELPTIVGKRENLQSNLNGLNEQERSVLNRHSEISYNLKNLNKTIEDINQAPLKRLESVKLKNQSELSKIDLDIQKLKFEASSKLSSFKNNALLSIRDKEVEIEKNTNLIKRKLGVLGTIQKTQEEISYLEAKKNMESNISRVLGRKGVLGLIFSEILAETEYLANKMLSEIPNTVDITLTLSSTTETKTGTVKNEINSKIIKAGNEISFKCLSGGQKATLSLCTDLALLTSIRRRTNINSGWLALDEALDGMDVASKEAAISMVKTVSSDVLVLLIDHSTEVKEMFDGVINVEFDGKTSRVVL